MRYLFEASYFGEKYSGWQRQPNADSVQAKIEEAFSTILREKSAIVGSGRTDAGVHAIQQYFHIDMNEDPEDLLYKLNSFLPDDIAILDYRAITADSHARFSALSRSYEYHINLSKDPFASGRSFYFRKAVDVDSMNEAAKLLIGDHDFKSFSKVKTDVKDFKCDLKAAFWHEDENHLFFYVTANRFLRGMVRALVGTLLMVGEGKITREHFQEILEGKDRKLAGQNVPAGGLFLTNIEYPEEIFI